MAVRWGLWVAVMLTAVVQVLCVHQQRQLLKDWQQQDVRRQQLQQEYSMLLLERGTLGAHNRLDRLARKQLNMIEPQGIQVLKP